MNSHLNNSLAAFWLFGIFLNMQAWAEPNLEVRERALRSVVHITATNCSDHTSRTGSGFALDISGRIVTAHHVVGGCQTLLVRYDGAATGVPASKTATMARVLPRADIALLTVNNPPPVPVLRRAPPPPDRNDAYAALGYQNGQVSAGDLKVTFSTGQNRLASILTPEILSELQQLNSPIDTHQSVLRFNVALQPGMSGGPIIDTNGDVIGIVAGGLKAGAAPASWGWPSEWIGSLLSSTAAVTQSINIAKAYYTLSELEAVNLEHSRDRIMQCGTLNLRYFGTRSFDSVARGADDYPRVQHLMSLSQMTIEELNALTFDIWVHEPSGATAVTPAGYELITESGICVTRSEDGVFQQVIWGSQANNPAEIQYLSSNFEMEVMRPRVPNFSFWIDPQLTTMPNGTPGPIFRENGMVFNRKGFSHAKQSYVGVGSPKAHSFETLIAKAGTFLGVGTVNNEVSAQLPQCLQTGIQQTICAAARHHLNEWTHFILATQLSTYPTY